MPFDYWQRLEEESYYHIYNRVASGQQLFRDNEDYQNFLTKWDIYFKPYLSLLCYCLVPNHFHFLVKVRKLEEDKHLLLRKEGTKAAFKLLKNEIPVNDFLIDQFRRYLSSVSLQHKSKYNRSGPLFLPKVKRVRISTDAKLQYVFCYIHHNVIHHNLGNDFDTWEYSSFPDYLTLNQSRVAIQLGHSCFGGRVNFQIAHQRFKLDKIELEDMLIDRVNSEINKQLQNPSGLQDLKS